MTDNNPLPPVTPAYESTPVVPPPTTDELNMGMLCHLLGIFTMWVGPLIIWLLKKDSSKYIDAQGKEALNFQITWTIGCFLCLFGLCFALPLMALVQITRIVFSIIGTVEANKGELYRYPVTFRFIK
jgi:uncharacterized Tic20 family protein